MINAHFEKKNFSQIILLEFFWVEHVTSKIRLLEGWQNAHTPNRYLRIDWCYQIWRKCPGKWFLSQNFTSIPGNSTKRGACPGQANVTENTFFVGIREGYDKVILAPVTQISSYFERKVIEKNST